LVSNQAKELKCFSYRKDSRFKNIFEIDINFNDNNMHKIYWKNNNLKIIKQNTTSPNRTVTVRRLSAARLHKTPVGLTPFVVFCSATFGAGVVAAQRPIACPKCQLQPER
jgi:uncharacterized protein YbcV (DUF1398 family)